MLDINSSEFAKQFDAYIDFKVEKKFKELINTIHLESVGKVAISGNGTTIQVYINNSQTAVEVKNPRSFSLDKDQLVAIVFPNFRNDNSKYIDRIL